MPLITGQVRKRINDDFPLTSLLSEGLIRTLIGSIAQLVEQGIENPCVPGSIPGRATMNSKEPRFLKRSWVFYCLLFLLYIFHNKLASNTQPLRPQCINTLVNRYQNICGKKNTEM
jgi:hypothetical protein